jgi:hypothetical protein
LLKSDSLNILEKEYQWIFKIINRVPGIENRAVFAECAKKYKHPNLLFNMLDGKDYSQHIWKLLYPTYSKPFKRDDYVTVVTAESREVEIDRSPLSSGYSSNNFFSILTTNSTGTPVNTNFCAVIFGELIDE